MYMMPFHALFPELAEKETRRIMIFEEQGKLPKGDYYLVESYCNDPKCDCRRVFLNVIHKDQIIATIGFGWEDEKFYRTWLKGNDKLLNDMKGPILEPTCKQSALASPLLDFFKKIIEPDQNYVNRLNQHYILFKEKLNTKKPQKIGRNDTCSCGSGKKFKKCCFGKED